MLLQKKTCSISFQRDIENLISHSILLKFSHINLKYWWDFFSLSHWVLGVPWHDFLPGPNNMPKIDSECSSFAYEFRPLFEDLLSCIDFPLRDNSDIFPGIWYYLYIPSRKVLNKILGLEISLTSFYHARLTTGDFCILVQIA